MRLPEKIPCDKRLHMLLGVCFISLLKLFDVAFEFESIGLIVFAWSIEFYQRITKSGNYDDWDAIAVVIGGLIVI